MKRFKKKSSSQSKVKKIEDSQKEIPKEELEKINQNFEKLISMMNLDPNKQETMRNLPLPQKLKLLEGSQLQKQAKTAEEYIKELSTQPTLEIIRKLSVELRTSQISWVKEFVEASGHAHLLNLLRVTLISSENDLNLILECSKAVKSLMNNTSGLMAVLKLENSTKILALGLTCSSEKVLQIIMDLLAAISTFPDFNEKVNECINNVHFEKKLLPYSLILNILTQSDDVELKTSAMTLIHGLTSNPDIAQRIQVRFAMFEIGLGDWLEIVNRKKNDSLTNLIELFENNMSVDMKELEETFGTSEFNLFSSEKIMKQLTDQIKDEEFSEVPLNILRSLIFLLYRSPFERQDIFTSIYDLLMECIQNIDTEESFRNLVFNITSPKNENTEKENETIFVLRQRSQELEKEIEDNSLKFVKIINEMKNYYEIMINKIKEQSKNQNRMNQFKKKYSKVILSLKNENENLLKANKDLKNYSIQLQDSQKQLIQDFNNKIKNHNIQVLKIIQNNNINKNVNVNHNNQETKTPSTEIANKSEMTTIETTTGTNNNNQIEHQNKQIINDDINDQKSKLIVNQTKSNNNNQIIKAEETKFSSTNNIPTTIENEKKNNTTEIENEGNIDSQVNQEIKLETEEKEEKKEKEMENENQNEYKKEKEEERKEIENNENESNIEKNENKSNIDSQVNQEIKPKTEEKEENKEKEIENENKIENKIEIENKKEKKEERKEIEKNENKSNIDSQVNQEIKPETKEKKENEKENENKNEIENKKEKEEERKEIEKNENTNNSESEVNKELKLETEVKQEEAEKANEENVKDLENNKSENDIKNKNENENQNTKESEETGEANEKENKGSTIPPPPNMGGGMGGIPPPPNMGGGGGIPPPPNMGGGGGGIPPPPNMGGGMGGLPPPPNFGGGGIGGLPPPPNFGGGGGGLPPPPNFGGGFARKPREPKSNLVALNWKKLPNNVSSSGYWSNITVDDIDINVDGFLKLFEKKKKVNLKKDTSNTLKTNQGVISGKKISNVEITLRKLKKNEKEIVKSILQLDENVLNEDSIRSIIAQLPTDEENTKIREYKGDFSKLSLAEKYFKELLIVENVEKRLKTYGFNLSFQETIDSVEPQIRYLEKASTDLKGSQEFKTLMQIILKMGNLMNGGSFRGGAMGFNLEILPKLKDTKSTKDRSLNFMHFFAKVLTEKYPKTLKILEAIPLYEKAANIDLPMLTASINNIEKNFKDIEKEIQYLEEKDDNQRLKQDLYLKKMKPFLIKAKKQFQRISETLKRSVYCFEITIEHFGMKDDKTTPKYFFGLLKEFLINLRNANKENLKQIEEEKKKKLMEERKAKRLKMKKIPKVATTMTDEKGVMDNLIEKMRSGEAFKLKKTNKEPMFKTKRHKNSLIPDFRSQLRRNVGRNQTNRVSRIKGVRDRKF
ncbi:protein diaphanous [Anaeramoeba flamelloides]|uniref:Protein diaphanous n=1 Tax=Anaeramoeba flamelloides TaxID=1746091 RepID=A0ABQ8YW24_9EUKA|nr:protein diaphanous [Anaeramoeba flamelloides]